MVKPLVCITCESCVAQYLIFEVVFPTQIEELKGENAFVHVTKLMELVFMYILHKVQGYNWLQLHNMFFSHATCVIFLVLKGYFILFSWLHVLFSMVIGLFFYLNKLSQNLQPISQRRGYHHLCTCIMSWVLSSSYQFFGMSFLNFVIVVIMVQILNVTSFKCSICGYKFCFRC